MLLTQFAVAGGTFIMGVPGADDVMLNYQSTSFHDALYIRQLLGLRPAPEFEHWLQQQQIFTNDNRLLAQSDIPALFKPSLQKLIEFGNGQS
jgi:ethanolamine ammonia-lyase large subunit